jgi:hypothetical protein
LGSGSYLIRTALKPLKTTLQILFAVSFFTLSLCDCNGPTESVYDGPWEKVSVPEGMGNDAIHFNSPTDGWSCGFRTIGHWNGKEWEIVKEFGNTSDEKYYLGGISSVAPDDIWFSGTIAEGDFPYTYTGVIIHYDGVNWDEIFINNVSQIIDIWMFDDGTGWGGGGSTNGTYYFDGTDWTKDNDYPIGKFHFNSKTDGWACGLSSIYHWDGTEWTLNFSYSTVWFRDIYFTGPNDGWAAGSQSLKGVSYQYHWDGTKWSRIEDEVFDYRGMNAVHFVDSDWGWMVGSARAFFYDGNKWTEFKPYGGVRMHDVYCVNKNDVWAAGYPDFMHFSGFKK